MRDIRKKTNNVKVMNVLFFNEKISTADYIHNQLVRGGFDLNQPIIAGYGSGEDDLPDLHKMFLMQEIIAGKGFQ